MYHKPPSPLPLGHVIRERYEVKALLGQGGMGSVYHVYDRLRRRDVALKKLHPHLGEDTSTQLLRELSLQERVPHIGITRTYDADIDPETGGLFFTMALIKGPSLEDLLQCLYQHNQHPALDMEKLQRLMISLLDIFKAIHSQGIIHGDIKPSHILFAPKEPKNPAPLQTPTTTTQCLAWMDEQPKLIDFGLARPVAISLFPTGGAGTPPSMAPEQWQSKTALTATTDIYALGLILYRLVTGAPHIGGQLPTPSAWLQTHGHTTFPQPQQEKIDTLITQCLAYRTEDRFQYASALQQALQKTLTPRTYEETPLYPPKHDEASHSAPLRAVEPQNRSIEWSDTPISIQELEALSKAPQLRHLSICRTALQDHHLVYLSSLTMLETLRLAGNQLTGKGLQYLQGLTKLRMLSLADNPLQTDTLASIQCMQSLKWLSLRGCSVNTDIFLYIQSLPSLTTLHLSENPIGNEAIVWLAQMKSLRELSLHHTHITKEGITQLESSHPSCTISYSSVNKFS